MAVMVETMTLREAGVRALIDTLGLANAQTFLKQWRGIPGRDSEKRMREREMTMDEIMASAARMRAEDETTGRGIAKWLKDREEQREKEIYAGVARVDAEITSPVELRKTGVRALIDVMGLGNAEDFLKQWRGIPGRDFAKWLKEQPEPSHEEFMAGLMRASLYSYTSGHLAGKTVMCGESSVLMGPKTTDALKRHFTEWLKEHPEPTPAEVFAEIERALEMAEARQGGD